jgi:hypothetical protein
MKAFQYIPLGYAVFLLDTVLLVWLIVRVGAIGVRRSVVFAAKLGGVIAGAGSLGMASMLALSSSMLLIWFIDGTAVFCVAGAIIGNGLSASRLLPLTVRVVGFFLACVVVIVVMQTLGLSPAGEVLR